MTMIPTLITEYSHSLSRMDAEKELQAELVAKAEQAGIVPAVFRKTALAYHRDKVPQLREITDAQLALLESLNTPAGGE